MKIHRKIRPLKYFQDNCKLDSDGDYVYMHANGAESYFIADAGLSTPMTKFCGMWCLWDDYEQTIDLDPYEQFMWFEECFEPLNAFSLSNLYKEV